MPANRMLHKRALAGARTNALTNLEWRVWTVYEMAADDFGVMRCHEEAWISAHPYFAREKVRALRAAIERVINSTLLGRFKAENGLTYVYQRDWQDWQKIEWPSITTNPRIPDEFLSGCSPLTQRLFTVWPGGKRFRLQATDGPHLASQSPTHLGSDLASESRSHLALRANTHTHANANGSEGGLGETESPELLAWRFWREAHQRQTGVVLRLEPNALEFGKLSEFCHMVPDATTRGRLILDFLALDERECRQRNVKTKSLGYLVMAVPGLLEREASSEASEIEKFLKAGSR